MLSSQSKPKHDCGCMVHRWSDLVCKGHGRTLGPFALQPISRTGTSHREERAARAMDAELDC